LQIGFGSYASAISYTNALDDKFAGGQASVFYAPTDNIAIKATIYSLENEIFSFIKSDGYDLVIYAGQGLISNGFKFYGGAGIFKETWSLFGSEDVFTGIQLNGGIGYNWENVALDLDVGVREITDYDNIFSPLGYYVDAVASSSLTLSIRF